MAFLDQTTRILRGFSAIDVLVLVVKVAYHCTILETFTKRTSDSYFRTKIAKINISLDSFDYRSQYLKNRS